jgi:hypothetical protein
MMHKHNCRPRTLFCAAGVLLATQVWALPSLGSAIQPGLWEVKVTQQVVDGQDVHAKMAAVQSQMAQAMKNMPPAQRQQMEKMMGGRIAAGDAAQVCISPAMAAMDKPLPSKDMQCETIKTQRSGNNLDYEVSCKNATHTFKGKGKSIFTATGMKTQMDMQTQDSKSGQQHHMQTATDMRFISKDCGAVKPLDQLAQELQAGVKAQPKR